MIGIRQQGWLRILTLFLMVTFMATSCQESNQSSLDLQLTNACADESASCEIIFHLLDQGASINATNQVGGTPLLLAAQTHENPQVVIALINAEADPNQATNDGMTPLMQAALYNNNPEILSTLLNFEADVNLVNDKSINALMFACLEPNVEKVKLLLAAGSPINSQSDGGMTPLMWAAMQNSDPEVIAELLRAGADPYMLNDEKKMAFDYAKENPSLVGSQAYKLLEAASTR